MFGIQIHIILLAFVLKHWGDYAARNVAVSNHDSFIHLQDYTHHRTNTSVATTTHSESTKGDSLQGLESLVSDQQRIAYKETLFGS